LPARFRRLAPVDPLRQDRLFFSVAENVPPGVRIIANGSTHEIVDGMAFVWSRPVLNEDLVTTLNAGYIWPPDAGPAWRQAVAEGIDMSLVERALARSAWDRLQDHDEALCFARMLQHAAARRHE
jgi:hypothetical protein